MNKAEAKTLFTKYINNQCSLEEQELLEAFLDSYQEQNLLLNESNNETQKESKAKVWQNIMSEIDTESKDKKPFPFRSYFVYAAAASLALFFTVSIFFQDKKKQSMSPIVAEQDINIGTDKATLTLEDGSAIALEKGENYQNDNANSNGEELIYHSDAKNVSEKIVYNFLTIPRGGQFFVELSDGTKVWLNSESKLRYPVSFKEGEPRNVELVYGEAYFDVSPSERHQGSSFSVGFQGQNIEVLGTEFNVKAYNDETITYTTLVEGKIALNTNNKSEVLKPEQQAIYNKISRSFEMQTVDVYSETSWKDGIFSFKGKSLVEITKVLSRWYNVDFVFNNKALESMAFKGVLGKDQSIEDILNSIKSASEIESYDIIDKIIYIK